MTGIPQHIHRQTEDKKKRSNTRLGPLSKKSAHVPHYVDAPVEFTDPGKVSNAGSRKPLRMSEIWTAPTRPGSMDAYSLPSLLWSGR